MKISKQIIAIVFIGLFVIGCTSIGNQTLSTETEISVEQKITAGTTTLAEIKAMFGSPMKTSFTDGGLEIWTYELTDSQLDPISYVPILNLFGMTSSGTKKELVVLFDENGVVKTSRMSESDVELKTGIYR